jgi:hypothetical protein
MFADISFLVSDSATVKLVSGMISGFRRQMAWNCALLGCYAACSGNFLLNYHYLLCNNPEKRSALVSGTFIMLAR